MHLSASAKADAIKLLERGARAVVSHGVPRVHGNLTATDTADGRTGGS
jgi:hypothetical protein